MSGVASLNGLAQDPLVAEPYDWCSEAKRFSYLQAGTGLDGTWRLGCQVPDDVRNGTYTILAAAVDGRRNFSSPGTDGPTVTVAGGKGDVGRAAEAPP